MFVHFVIIKKKFLHLSIEIAFTQRYSFVSRVSQNHVTLLKLAATTKRQFDDFTKIILFIILLFGVLRRLSNLLLSSIKIKNIKLRQFPRKYWSFLNNKNYYLKLHPKHSNSYQFIILIVSAFCQECQQHDIDTASTVHYINFFQRTPKIINSCKGTLHHP